MIVYLEFPNWHEVPMVMNKITDLTDARKRFWERQNILAGEQKP